jgi:hypothetical protein
MRISHKTIAYLTTIFVCATTFVLAEDSTRRKLDDAKDAYDKAIAEFRAQATEWFEREDAQARRLKKGVSEQVAKIEKDRQEFAKTDNLPEHAPLKLREKPNHAFSVLVRAYKTGSDDFLRQKLDSDAKIVADELADLEKSHASRGKKLQVVDEVRFTGKDFTGWKGFPQFWKIQNGTIFARNGKGLLSKGGTCLLTEREFGDFEMTCSIRASAKPAPSCGIVFRTLPLDMKMFQVEGPFCRLSPNKADWGNVGYTGLRDLRQASVEIPNVIKIGEFNSFYIRCVGQHLIIKINGKTAVDDTIPRLPVRGMVGFQFFKDPPDGEITIRDVVIRDVSEDTSGN